MLLVVGITLAALVVATRLLSSTTTSTVTIGSEQLALVAFVLLAIPAAMSLRSRDPRRFAVGVVIAAVVFFVAWYPNLTGLPLPSDFANVYLGLLPTWNYSFQFAVNLDQPISTGMIDQSTLVVGAITVILGIIVMVAARYWAPARSARAAEVREGA
jgi:hypothetical protein